MLPDYSGTKKLFRRFFQTYMRQKAREMSPLADVQVRYLHEGHDMRVMRADKSESTSGMQQISTMMEMKGEEVPNLTLQDVLAKHDEMILDFVRKHTGLALERLSADLPESQSVDAKGKQLDAELVLQMLETIQLDFYPDGTPHELHVVGSLFSPERLKAVEEEFKNNPDLQRKYDELIERKREQWRDREANRKLVG